MPKILNSDGLNYYTTKIKGYITNLLSGKVDKETGKGLSTNDYTTTEKNKLSGIASGAEVNQNAFSNITVGTTTISADSKTDTLILEAGDNITLSPNSTSDKITISSSDTQLSLTNNLLATTAGTALDATQGKTLNDKITALETNINRASYYIKKYGYIGFSADMQANTNTVITVDLTNYGFERVPLISTAYTTYFSVHSVRNITTTSMDVTLINNSGARTDSVYFTYIEFGTM